MAKSLLILMKNLKREEVLEFAKKISYEKRKSQGFPKYFPGHLEASLQDGHIIQKDVFINKGNFDNPLSFEELKAKFLANAQIYLDNAKANKILDQIINLEKFKPLFFLNIYPSFYKKDNFITLFYYNIYY